jgi:glycosyltransferase involved in cell wall biosynthesis
MAVHQLLRRFTGDDAISEAAVELQIQLRRLGQSGDIYAYDVRNGFDALVRPVRELKPERSDLVLYHQGEWPSVISAAHFFYPWRWAIVFHQLGRATAADASFWRRLTEGFTLSRLSQRVELALARSDAAKAGLLSAGFQNVHVVPDFGADAEMTLRAALASVHAWPPPVSRRSEGKPRVGLIVQRFGDVSGGAEKHAEQIAQHLLPHVDLTILTTCARDHLTWRNEFPPGPQQVGPFRVIRFPSTRPRRMRRFNALSRQLFGHAPDRALQERWLAEQGPLVPGLLRHLEEHQSDYDAFIGFTYLYTPMAWGISLIGSRTLVIPTAHDEPPLAFEAFSDVFERPRALLCNTPEEIELIDRRFPRHARARAVGVGIDAPAAAPERFAQKYGQTRPYLFYVGRIETGKGIPELLQHQAALVRRDPSAPDLLLAGTASMRVSGTSVRHLGRISDEDKYDGIAGALAVVVPSPLESLSLLALEAFAQGTPVIANAASDVLAGQIGRSEAGALFHDTASFAGAVVSVRANRERWAGNGRAFAQKHRWNDVVQVYLEEIRGIMNGSPRT